MTVRGVRGATVANGDTAEEILNASQELLEKMMKANPKMRSEDLASAFFTVTPDLVSTHPARAARLMGWDRVPLLCAQEIPIPGSLPRCIRVLLHWNTSIQQAEVVHVYLREAAALRPDLTQS
ncbi:MAG: chorismate mutase [Anaerolineae bacterium]|nr:chorismate mutase [Anaerolineae bacterium]